MADTIKLFYDGFDADQMYDNANIRRDYTTFRTSIEARNPDTGEIIFKDLHNKVIIPGAGLIARKLFDIESDEVTPSYNEKIPTMVTPTNDDQPANHEELKTNATKDNHKVLLFCVGTDGCGTQNSQVFPVDYKKWIAPKDLVPFRYTLKSADISDDLRATYFGRTVINDEFVAYYFKRFDTEPVIVQQFVDGTTVTSDIYDSVKTEPAETYVELSLKITKADVRDYFSATVGIDQARINTISLCSAYPVKGDDDDFIYFKEIRPITKLNFPNEPFIDVTKGIDIIYHIYM